MSKVSINILIDALGFELLRERPFLPGILKTKKRLKTILGYSASAVPSILTGKRPNEHNIWSYFYYSPEMSPFRGLEKLEFLPKFISEKGKFRKAIKERVRKKCGYTGAFEIYNVPFKYLPLFGFSLKKDVFKPNAFECDSIFDILKEKNIDYGLFNWPLPDAECLKQANESIKKGEFHFYFLYLPEMDAILHRYGPFSKKIEEKLYWYESEIRKIYDNAIKNYNKVELNVFSDHGMTNIVKTFDVMNEINNLNFKYKEDYIAVYDSTMARFWFFSEKAKDKIIIFLNSSYYGRILKEEELIKLGVYWNDNRYGEIIFLMEAGYLINPSYMGKNAPKAMHGFHPDDKTSDGIFMSNITNVANIKKITDIKDRIII